MKKVVFYAEIDNGEDKEYVEYEDDATDKEITDDFNEWLAGHLIAGWCVD